MSIEKLPEVVYPLAQVGKINELVDAVNETVSSFYTATNPALTPVEGVVTWTVTHNLGTEQVHCSLYENDNLVVFDLNIISENQVSVSFMSDVNIEAGTHKILISGNEGSSGGGGSYTLPVASTSTLGGVKIDGTSITIDENGVISSSTDALKPDLSNINSTGASAITTLAMPSATYDVVTPLASGGQYTAPADGYYFINLSSSSTSSGGWSRLNWEDGLWLAKNVSMSDHNMSWIVPIRKGVKLQVSFSGGVSISMMRFYYC